MPGSELGWRDVISRRAKVAVSCWGMPGDKLRFATFSRMRALTASRSKRGASAAALLAVIVVFAAAGKHTAAPPDVEMWRPGCGEFRDFDISGTSGTFAYPIKKKTLSDGCYLIRHGKQLMFWDTGLSPSVIGGE